MDLRVRTVGKKSVVVRCSDSGKETTGFYAKNAKQYKNLKKEVIKT